MVNEIKQNKIISVILWIVAVFFILGGIIEISKSVLSGILIIVAGLIILPPITKIIKQSSKGKIKTWMIIILFLGLLIGGMISSPNYTNINEEGQTSNQVQQELITKSLEEMLPKSYDLPTEYSIGEIEPVTKESEVISFRNAQEGFEEGSIFSITKYKQGIVSVTDFVEVTFGVYKFEDLDYAKEFKGQVANSIREGGGYEEINVRANANCFSWKEDHGYLEGRVASSICQNKNVVFWISVSTVNNFKQPDNILEDMVKIVDNKVK